MNLRMHRPAWLGRATLAQPLHKLRHIRPRTIVIAVVTVLILGAWVAVLAEKHVDRQDPAAVALEFITNLQDGKTNHAYELTSAKYQKAVSYRVFADNVVPSTSDNWSLQKPRPYATAKPPNGDKNMVQVIFEIPKDAGADGYKAAIMLVRSGPGAPWQVEGLTSAPDNPDKKKSDQ